MVTKTLKDPLEIMNEITILMDRAMSQIVNVMRHQDLQKASKIEIRNVDQLTRSLEYLCDTKEYQRKITRKIIGMLKNNREQKKIIRKLQKGKEIENFGNIFNVEVPPDELPMEEKD